MKDAYHPNTLEYIPTDTPADWMLRAGVAAPAYNPANDGLFWQNGAWVIVSALPQIMAGAKVSAWSRIKAKRSTIELGGVQVGAKWYHTDEASLIKYLGLFKMAEQALTDGGTGAMVLQYGGVDIRWKTLDGTFVNMTVQLAQDVYSAVIGLNFSAFAAAETHKTAMEAAVDPAAYDFSAGWPASFPVA